MRRFTGLTAVAAGVVLTALLVFSLRGATVTSATGTGPAIAPGTVSGTTVPINAGVSTDPWNGFNVHVHSAAGGGATVTSIAGNTSGTILAGSVFCSTTGALPEYVYGCVGLASQTITAAGLLANFVVNASGNGCVEINLVTVPGDATLDTYTIDVGAGDAQANTVDTATKAKVLIGTGVLADCPSNNLPTNTPTDTATPTNTATPTSTATPTTTPIAGSVDVVVNLSGLPLTVPSGAGMSYTALVANHGSATALGVLLKITLPSGGVLTSGSACRTYIAPNYFCTVGTLAADNGSPGGPDETAIVFTANAPYSLTDISVTATAMVSATNEPVGNQGNNTGTASTSVIGCPDLDADGVITILDLSVAGNSFGKHPGDPGYKAIADLDGDSAITVLDLSLIASHLGQHCSGFDTDHDGLSDSAELTAGTNKNNPDSDGDGLPDGVEVYSFGSNPTNIDSDGDNYTDGEEAALGKTPTVFCKVMRADIDKDHVVSILDLSATASAYLKMLGQPGFRADADFDHDNVISILDLSYQASVYLQNIAVCP